MVRVKNENERLKAYQEEWLYDIGTPINEIKIKYV